VGSSTPSPPSLGDRRFVVVNCEEDEEVKKKMISLWKKKGRKQGRATGRGSYIDKTRNRQAPLPPPTTPLLPVCATRLRIGLRLGREPHDAFHLGGKEKGRVNDVGPTCQRQQPNCGAFSISIYCFITTWPRRHLQLSTLELVASFNFNPSRQLHPSSTSILLPNFIPRRSQLQPLSPFKFQTPSLCYFLYSP
jgi:hypothetical protein